MSALGAESGRQTGARIKSPAASHKVSVPSLLFERFARLTSELGFGRFKTRGSRCDLKSICSQINFRERVCQQCRSNCVGNVFYQATWKYLCRSRNEVVAADSPTVNSAQVPSSAPLLLLDHSYLDSRSSDGPSRDAPIVFPTQSGVPTPLWSQG
jgi:hypothetical protein